MFEELILLATHAFAYCYACSATYNYAYTLINIRFNSTLNQVFRTHSKHTNNKQFTHVYISPPFSRSSFIRVVYVNAVVFYFMLR